MTILKKYCFLPLLIFLICSFALLSCSQKEGQEKENKKPITIETFKVIKKTIPLEVSSFGYLSSKKIVEIQSQISGQIEKVFFKKGSSVKQGEILFTINSTPYQAALLNDESILQEDKYNLTFDKYTIEQNKGLAKSGVLPAQSFERMKTNLQVAESQINVDKASIAKDKINLNYCTITSPINGIIGINNIDEGNIISPGTVMATVRDIGKLYVQFDIPGSDYPLIKKSFENSSLKAKIYRQYSTHNGQQIDEFDAQIDFLNSTIDSTTGMLTLKAIVDNKDYSLLPGEYVSVKLIIGYQKDIMLVPKSAVQFNSSGQYLFLVLKNGEVREVTVSAKNSYGDYLVVSSGNISPGDKVAIINWSVEPMAFLIRSKQVTDSYRSF